MTKVEKKPKSQSSFIKDPGGPKNKEQNFSAHFHSMTCEMSAYGVPHQMSPEESLCCYSKRNQKSLANFSQSFS